MRKVMGLKGIWVGIILLILSIDSNAQKKPYMWVKKEIGDARKKEFIDKKKRPLTRAGIVVEDYLYYPSFFLMLDGLIETYGPKFSYLRVYFAVYPGTESELANNLTLIFAPVDCYNDDLGEYFNMKPGSSDVDEISPDKKKKWTDLYISKQERYLVKTIDDVEENRIDSALSDTRSIRYLVTNLVELKNELERDHYYMGGTSSAEITGMTAFFAAFKDAGNESRGGIYKKRLHLEFEFTDQYGTPVYLDYDKDDQFSHKKHPYPNLENAEFLSGYVGINNGQLCPANCPPK